MDGWKERKDEQPTDWVERIGLLFCSSMQIIFLIVDVTYLNI